MARPLRIMPRVKAALAALAGSPSPARAAGTRRSASSPIATAAGLRGLVGEQGFDAAETHRLNEHRWALAGDSDVNQMLYGRLAIMRGRCRYEARNNPYARGIMETYASHVVGPTGPMLQVECGDKEFAKALEAAWWKSVASCDASGTQDLVEMARMWIHQCWTDGEFLVQKYLDPRDGLVLNDIDPGRLAISAGAPEAGNHIIMGVERTPLGRPERYHITNLMQGAFGQVSAGNAKAISARFILHRFQQWYPNQARGIPWFSPALEDMANVREYDQYVLETAKGAARFAGILEPSNAEPVVFDAPEFFDVEPGQIMTGPQGHKLTQMKAEQPTASYRDFIHERRRGMGRVKSMPLLMINLDAGNHNMAGARFDGKIYEGHVKSDQRWLTERTFKPLLDDVALFLWLTEFGRGDASGMPSFEARWTCETVPATDPYKDAMAARERIFSGISSQVREAAAIGNGLDDLLLEQKREIEERKRLGLPLGPYGEAAVADAALLDPGAKDEGRADAGEKKEKRDAA